VGLDHLDNEDGLTYKVTRVERLKGYIVAYRRLVTPRASDTREELVSVHIADICLMTDDFVQARKASAVTPNQDSRPASNGTPETPSQRTSTVM
jgi:heme-binding NEAT domain protein